MNFELHEITRDFLELVSRLTPRLIVNPLLSTYQDALNKRFDSAMRPFYYLCFLTEPHFSRSRRKHVFKNPNSVIPKMYGLPKIHKPGNKFRPIVFVLRKKSQNGWLMNSTREHHWKVLQFKKPQIWLNT